MMRELSLKMMRIPYWISRFSVGFFQHLKADWASTSYLVLGNTVINGVSVLKVVRLSHFVSIKVLSNVGLVINELGENLHDLGGLVALDFFVVIAGRDDLSRFGHNKI